MMQMEESWELLVKQYMGKRRLRKQQQRQSKYPWQVPVFSICPGLMLAPSVGPL